MIGAEIRMAIPLLGYGSLMSGHGLRRLGRLAARRVRRVELANTRRGFGKASQHGDRLAMVLEPLDPRLAIRVRSLSPARRGGPAQGILVDLELDDLARVAQREGYAPAAVATLAKLAGEAGETLPRYLSALLAAAGGDIADYRRRLCQRLGYTSAHYIPHPVEIDGDTPGLTFLAPGAEGTGDPDVVAVRVATARPQLLDIAATWQVKPNPTQLDYFAMCLLAAQHGVRIDDIAAPLAAAAGVRAALRAALPALAAAEVDAFRSALGVAEPAYRAFAAPADLLYSRLLST